MITVTLRPDHGEPFEVTAGTRDIYTWEKTSKGKTFSQLQEDPSVVDMYEIAWHAARRQGLFTGPLADFVATYELEQEDSDGDEKPVPFDPAPSDGPPSGSPSTPASRRSTGSTRERKR